MRGQRGSSHAKSTRLVQLPMRSQITGGGCGIVQTAHHKILIASKNFAGITSARSRGGRGRDRGRGFHCLVGEGLAGNGEAI